MSEATPRPWFATPAGSNMQENYSQSHAVAEYKTANLIAGVFSDVPGGASVAEANAALIVKAVNAYDDMLAALRHVLEYGDLIGADKEMISAAIAKAEGAAR